MVGVGRLFSSHWRELSSWVFRATSLCCLSVIGLLQKMEELEGELRRRACMFLTAVLLGKNNSQTLIWSFL